MTALTDDTLPVTPRAIRDEMIVFVVMALLLASVPFTGVYPFFVMQALCFALLACAFNLLIGYGGLLSFGHAMFLGTAGYCSAHALKVWGLPPDRDDTGDHGKRAGRARANEDAEHRLQVPDLQRMRAAIAGRPEEHRVSERQQAAITDQQIERAGDQRKAQRLHHEEGVNAAERHGRQQQRHNHEPNHLVTRRVRRHREGIVGQC